MEVEFGLVLPCDRVDCPDGSMPGYGTYEENGAILSNTMGYPALYNRLICVNPIKGKYTGEVGNVVVGRISQVANKRWKVEVEAAQEASLFLSSIDLPTGEHRIRSEEDQLNMREFFNNHELLSAEVQQISQEGKALSLQTRTKKFGKLKNGMLVKVSCKLVDRLKHHFVRLEIGVDIIFGRNGLLWVYMANEEEVTVPVETRQQIVRVANLLKLLNKARCLISPDSLMKAYQVTSHIQYR